MTVCLPLGVTAPVGRLQYYSSKRKLYSALVSLKSEDPTALVHPTLRSPFARKSCLDIRYKPNLHTLLH
jgi:hypothetical protein